MSTNLVDNINEVKPNLLDNVQEVERLTRQIAKLKADESRLSKSIARLDKRRRSLKSELDRTFSKRLNLEERAKLLAMVGQRVRIRRGGRKTRHLYGKVGILKSVDRTCAIVNIYELEWRIPVWQISFVRKDEGAVASLAG